MSVRGIKIELSSDQRPYRGTTKRAVLDFAPEGIAGDGWGQAPTEETVREVYRVLVHAAEDEPSHAYAPRITSCEPDPESPIKHTGTRGKPGGGSESEIRQASRWIVTSHTPYCD